MKCKQTCKNALAYAVNSKLFEVTDYLILFWTILLLNLSIFLPVLCKKEHITLRVSVCDVLLSNVLKVLEDHIPHVLFKEISNASVLYIIFRQKPRV